MIDTVDILRQVRSLGADVTLADVEQAVKSIDTTLFELEERAKYRVEVWDKKSPINGVPADVIIERHNILPEGHVYLIYTNDVITHLQPFNPDGIGFAPMTYEEALSYGNRDVNLMVSEAVDRRVTNIVIKKLLGSTEV